MWYTDSLITLRTHPVSSQQEQSQHFLYIPRTGWKPLNTSSCHLRDIFNYSHLCLAQQGAKFTSRLLYSCFMTISTVKSTIFYCGLINPQVISASYFTSDCPFLRVVGGYGCQYFIQCNSRTTVSNYTPIKGHV